MTGIQEFTLQPDRPMALEVPAGAEILGVGLRGGSVRVWVMGEIRGPEDPPGRVEMRRLVCLETGNSWDEVKIPGEMKCLGNVLMPGTKPKMVHVFEVVQRIIRLVP